MKSTGVIVQSWVSPRLAAELKRRAEAERRSVSSTIRIALEDRLRLDAEGGRMARSRSASPAVTDQSRVPEGRVATRDRVAVRPPVGKLRKKAGEFKR
jgi:hypothetical protein